MLSLDSPRWRELQHAYGSAEDIPALLLQLRTLPESLDQDEPWFSLWSSLAHQGDVYSASFAAVPHVVQLIKDNSATAPDVFFYFPAWVEICRHRNQTRVTEDLLPAYQSALETLSKAACSALSRPLDHDFLLVTMSAIAAGKNAPNLAAAILELTEDVLDDFRNWIESR